MDEEIAIIDSRSRSEKIKNFFIRNKKRLIIFLSLIIFLVLILLAYKEFSENQKVKISNFYNSTIINYSEEYKEKTANDLMYIINEKDPTYSPLSLYFIIDNNLVLDKKKINELFDTLILKTSLEKEIKNLIIYKKALYNADHIDENNLLDILNPIINNNSVWKSHALYLLAEYFYSKNEKQKAKEFYSLILNLNNSNPDILIESQKRLNRDLSD